MRWLIRLVAGTTAKLFYRIRHLGQPLPQQGPLVLVSNHPNGLIDPLMLLLSTRRPLSFLAKEPLFRMPIIGSMMRGMGALPVYRTMDGADTALNDRTFEAAFETLRKGGAIGIFPEGTSHSEPALQRLKTGAARMALGASNGPSDPIQARIVPVGLVYNHKVRFRSKMTVWIGEAISLEDLWDAHATDPREAVRLLTTRIDAGLRSVTLNLNRWDDLPILRLAERIWAEDRKPSLARMHALASTFEQLHAREPERMESLAQRVEELNQRLRFLGLTLFDLKREYTLSRVLRDSIQRVALLLITLLPAACGLLIWYVPYLAVGQLSKRLRSSRDVRASVKVLASIAIFPLWYAGIMYALLRWSNPLATLAGALLAPLSGLCAIHWAERFGKSVFDLGALLRSRATRQLRDKLVSRAEELHTQFSELADEMVEPEASPPT